MYVTVLQDKHVTCVALAQSCKGKVHADWQGFGRPLVEHGVFFCFPIMSWEAGQMAFLWGFNGCVSMGVEWITGRVSTLSEAQQHTVAYNL